jgi:hypothetical protein
MNRITARSSRGAAALLLSALLIVALACGDSDNEASDHGLMLRSYQVPDQTAAEMERILNNILRLEEISYGRAMEGPGGQVFVAAPESVHLGVEELIEQLRESSPTAPPTILLTYWAVIGDPAPETEVAPGLGEVEPALEAIAAADGPLSFTLLEKIRLHSLSGEKGKAEGQQLVTRQLATARDGRVIAYLEIGMQRLSGHTETRVNLEPDQVLVLGQTGLPNRPGERKHSATNLYIIVRAQVQSDS